MEIHIGMYSVQDVGLLVYMGTRAQGLGFGFGVQGFGFARKVALACWALLLLLH